jgi:hypothetical protein
MSWRRLSVPPVRVVLLAPLLLAGLFMRWPFIHGRISPQLGTDTIAYFAIIDGMNPRCTADCRATRGGWCL